MNDEDDLNDLLREERSVKVVGNDVIREIVVEAHMAGQIDAGVGPSYSNAKAYYEGLFEA